MIPLRLEITNFLSYRKTATVDFDGVHLACICGLNGAGKSTLLDAITWSLFGKSRSRSDDDVINRVSVRNGEAAEVRFTFDLDGTVYRVLRQKPHGRTAVLEFQMAANDDTWRTMSEGGVRQTQMAIENVLRMNFDTFINASFFLQGQADEFTTKTPGKRKEILADLLSVNIWDRYRAAAMDRRKEEEAKLLVLDARLKEIDVELDEQAQREADLAAAKEELARVSERLAEKEKLLDQMRRVESAIKQQKQTVQNLRESLTRAEATLNRLRQTQAQRQQERDKYQALLDDAEAIEAGYEAWQTAETELACWQEKADAFNQLEQERRPHELTLERERSALEQRKKELERQCQRAEEALAERQSLAAMLREGREQVSNLKVQLDALAEREDGWHNARAELQRLEAQRQAQYQELAKLKVEAQRMVQIQEERAAVQKNLTDAATALAAAEEEVASIQQKHEQLMQGMAERDTLQYEQQRLRESMSKLDERRQNLSRETGGACPLCGQALTEEHRQTVLAEVEADGNEQGLRFRNNKQRLEELKAEIEDLERAVKERDRWQRDVQTQRQRHARAQARLEEIERALTAWEADGAARVIALDEALADDSEIKEKQIEVAALGKDVQQKKVLEEAQREQQNKVSAVEARQLEIERNIEEWEARGQAELASVQQQLAEKQYAPEAWAALEAIDIRIEALAYDPASYTAAREARNQLAEAPARFQELKQAEAAVKPLEDALADLAEQLAEQDESVERLSAQHQEAVEQLEALSGDGGDLAQVEKEVNAVREQEVAANRRVGAAQQRLSVLDNLRRQRKEEKARRAELTRLIERLQRLEKACGRDGVQALLIEQALPEIEADANELLDRLTGGTMRVSFETQRELKSREALAETLDIRISDMAGERPYENFSGGEQFRVNFAIRLALSRILAKRAGARLQTLVIDEGFGSQDPEGRQRLVEAINTIQSDFARILVITHINELRDAFPTRIEVEKTPSGSQVVVV